RGDLLPEANPVSLRARAVATAFGLEPLRVYVDQASGRDVRLAADAKLALCIGAALAAPSAAARLTVEIARVMAFTAAGATIGAFLSAAELPGFIQAIGT